ncbi:MAG: branched-chain amino acid ABC transporter permease [Marinovum algicola]
MTFYGPEARPVQAPFNLRIALPWFGYSGYKLAVIAASIGLIVATWLVLTRTRIGLIMRATQFDRETAQNFGIPVDKVYAAVFALGAMLAAVAAVLIVPIQQAHYLMGLDPLLLSFIVVIIGGLGSIEGAFIGALLVGLLQNYIAFLEPKLALISNIGLMTAILMWRPQGMMPVVEAK